MVSLWDECDPSLSRTIVQDGVSGSINYDANDRFCLNGERLIRITLGLNYGAPGQEYRTEHESFTKIQSSGGTDGNPAYFVARTKSGQILYFGNTSDSTIEAFGTTKIRGWALSRVEDRVGNYLTISYYENSFAGGEHKPAVISYTGNSNTGVAPYASVTFNYESTTRPDAISGYESGSIIQDTRRLGSITTKVGANVVKNYVLTYHAALSPGTYRSRLQRITECDAAGTCLPATSATYADTTLAFGNTQWTAQGGAEVVVGDYNGDGRLDMANYSGSGGIWRICLSTGSGFSCNPWTARGGSSVETGDFNGDGRTDMASYTGNGGKWDVCLSINTGFSCTQWTTPFGAEIKTGDYDGNGKTDMVFYTGNGGIWWVCLSTGSGFSCNQWTTPFGAEIKSGDFNGDGKTDMSFYTGNGGIWWVCLSTGTGFSCTQWTTPFGAEIQTGDYNGDGKTDMVFYTGNGGIWWVCLSTGTGFSCNQWTTPFGAEIKTGDYNGDGKTDMSFYTGNGGIWWVCLSKGNAFSCNQWTAIGGGEAVVGDYDGDGKTDHALYTGNGGIWNMGLAGSGARIAPDSLTTITDGLGVQTTFTYKPITDTSVYSKGNSSVSPYVDVQAAIYLVSNTSTSNGIGGLRDLRYFYFTAIAHVQGGGMMGFGAMQVYDDLNQTIRTSWSRTDWPYQGFIYASQSQTFGGAILSRIDSTLSAQNTYAGVYFMYTSETKEKIFTASDGIVGSTGPSGTTQINLVSTVTEFADSPQYGNATKISVTDNAGAVSTTVNNYVNDLGNWNLGRLICASVTKTQPGGTVSQTRTSSFSYDPGAPGFLVSETIEPGTSCVGAAAASTDATLRLTTTYGYDSYGNKAVVTVSGGTTGASLVPTRTTTNSYAATATNPVPGRFATRTTNALNQIESREFDNRFGAMTKLTGPNSISTQWAYDSFGRKSRETRADGSITDWSYFDTSLPITYPNFAYGITTSPSTGTWSIVYFDQLNRPISNFVARFEALPGSYVNETEYDAFGRVARQYKNRLHDAAVKPYTSFTYDLLGRVVTSTAPNGLITTYGYNKDRAGNASLLSTTVRINNNTGTQITAKTVNTRGQITSTIDSAGYVTNFVYAYASNGSLVTTTTDPKGNKIVVTEDVAGQRLR